MAREWIDYDTPVELKPREREALVDALGYPILTSGDLEEFVGRKLGTGIAAITEQAKLSLMILRVVQWAEARSMQESLLRGAMEMFSANSEVTRVVPPLLERVQKGRQQDAKRAGIQQIQATPELADLTKNLGELVKVLQRMALGADPVQTRGALEAGKRAVTKLQESGEEADLTADEEHGLETIVLATSRPALLIQNGDFLPPPEHWTNLVEHRNAIRHAIAATGRIEMEGHALPWLGTGFLVAPQVVAIASYMASELGERKGGRWNMRKGLVLKVDFLKEHGSKETAIHCVTGLVGVDEELGIALLEVGTIGNGNLPAPLQLGASPITRSCDVYLVGYMAQDPRRPEGIMKAVLGNVFDVKRLCPGKILRVSSGKPSGPLRHSVIEHDCFSSGGMGGAPLVDLGTGKAIGLHFAARYLEAGYARRLSLLQDSELAKNAGLVFN